MPVAPPLNPVIPFGEGQARTPWTKETEEEAGSCLSFRGVALLIR